MSSRTPQQTNTRSHATRLDKVLAAGVAQINAMVPKRTKFMEGFPQAPNRAYAAVLEQNIIMHARQAIEAVFPELMDDLRSFHPHGFAEFESLLRLAQELYIPELGAVTSTARISKEAEDKYKIHLSVLVANGPHGLVFKDDSNDDTSLDLRNIRSFVKFMDSTQGSAEEFRQLMIDNPDPRDVFEALEGVDFLDPSFPPSSPLEGPESYYSHVVKDVIRRKAGYYREVDYMPLVKFFIELERAYLLTMLNIAYQPDQAIAKLNAWEAKRLFMFVRD